jgi:3-oxoacyl-[acyl-carrier protein] reductase
MRFEDIKVGQRAEMTRLITENDINAFMELTGDDNPLHMDDVYSSRTHFKKRVAHGMLSASFVSTIIGTKLPGAGALWVSQSFDFLKPVRIGDTLKITATVKQKSETQKTIVLDIEIANQNGQGVLMGRGVVKVLETDGGEREMDKRKQGAAIVTGASRGIGAETAFQLALKGYKVVVNYLENRGGAEAVANRIVEAGGEAMAYQADVRDAEQIVRMVEAAQARFGHVDVLVNNAASPLGYKQFDELEWGRVEDQLDVNLKAVFFACKAVLPGMAARRYGKIINMTSTFTDSAPPPKMYAYVIAKTALKALTKTLAVEYGPRGVNVNAVAPGMTETELIADVPEKAKMVTAMQTPLRRLAAPEDVARAVAFLASDEASYLTGETIRVCGGQVML